MHTTNGHELPNVRKDSPRQAASGAKPGKPDRRAPLWFPHCPPPLWQFWQWQEAHTAGSGGLSQDSPRQALHARSPLTHGALCKWPGAFPARASIQCGGLFSWQPPAQPPLPPHISPRRGAHKPAQIWEPTKLSVPGFQTPKPETPPPSLSAPPGLVGSTLPAWVRWMLVSAQIPVSSVLRQLPQHASCQAPVLPFFSL
jgi:hypothetical protein